MNEYATVIRNEIKVNKVDMQINLAYQLIEVEAKLYDRAISDINYFFYPQGTSFTNHSLNLGLTGWMKFQSNLYTHTHNIILSKSFHIWK